MAAPTQWPHHVKQEFCTTRATYREGRDPKAVKVYTVSQESRYLLVQGIPAVGAHDDLVKMFALYGTIIEYRMLDDYPCEEFTKVMWLKFDKIQAARIAKKKMDDQSFYGGVLHVFYAPEYETVQDTREKLQDRRKAIAYRIRKLETDKVLQSVQPSTSTMASSEEWSYRQRKAANKQGGAMQYARMPQPGASNHHEVPTVQQTPSDSVVMPHGSSLIETMSHQAGRRHMHYHHYHHHYDSHPWASGSVSAPSNHSPMNSRGNTQGRSESEDVPAYGHSQPAPGHSYPRLPPPPQQLPPHLASRPGQHAIHSQAEGYLGGTLTPSDQSATTHSRRTGQLGKDFTEEQSNPRSLDQVSVRKYTTDSKRTPKFIPRQVKSNQPALMKRLITKQQDNSNVAASKPLPVDSVNESLKLEAFVLRESQGPQLPTEDAAKRENFKNSETGSDSLDQTVAAIRKRVREFSAIAPPPQLKRKKKR